ncbi:Bifunctional ligase/repressor BirA [Caulifigura coniformis]|uniref:Bifunctional ligase/repressor BirA n=1 Tax=Caulifigura coniformis TaxID=2527983 RepID=A0A517SI19_9PLAN|nr:biotin--[acetyl-CoA-carboxylase] ligase [Caulifigura coniformis]QDT55757.1 Bifunctional ligase/repressor BirA [Caulifigura coniformis]
MTEDPTVGPEFFASLGEAVEPTFIRRAEHFDALPSTNDRALEIAASLPASAVPLLILADRQTAGRGRGRNKWFASEGVLTFSIVLEPETWKIPPELWPRLSVAVGGAVASALAKSTGPDRPLLKWPNDVWIRDRKVCGILIETSPAAPRRLVVGIGINVSNEFVGAPADVATRGIALSQVSVAAVPDRFSVLHDVLQQLDGDFRLLGEGAAELIERWRKICALTGRMVAIGEVDRVVSGVCAGLEDDASLLIRTEWGPQRCYAGTVTVMD